MLAQVRGRRLLHWYAPAGLAAVVAACLGAGFFLGLVRSFGEPLGPPPASARPAAAARASGLLVVALGDSLGRGLGDPRGEGYAARVAETLRRRGARVTFENLAVAGARTRDLKELLEGAEVSRQVAAAGLVLVSVGGNDLTQALRGAGAGGVAESRELAEALDAARANLRDVVARLRALNAAAPIRLLGLYNPFEVLPAAESEARAQLLAWNGAIEAATLPFRGVLAVPVADLFADRPDRLAGDRFHPGPDGHALIAERVLSTLPP
jgi:lysophospholipase L1-like esterase